MGLRFVLLLLAAALCWAPAGAHARKAALIIGNSSYEFTSVLDNPANDAALVAESARRAGFDDVTLVLDVGADAFQKALRDFRSKADGAEVAMVYYAGHGIEGQGKNWLIPIDAVLESDRDLPYETINLDRVMETLEGAQVRVVILDACRNNPFGRSWRSGTRAVNRGLVGIEADDVLVIYAAAPGQTASDGEGANSPFATSLAERLPTPDLPLQLLGGTVRDDVLMATGGSQRPFVSASITGTPVYLVPRTPLVASPAVAEPRLGADASAIEDLTWQGAMAANSVSAFSAYLTQFPEGKYAADAGANITALLGGGRTGTTTVQNAATLPASSPAPGAALRTYILSDLRIECVKLTGSLGLPDNLFLRFEDGRRFPGGKSSAYNVRKGDVWDVAETFRFGQPVSFQVMEHDPIGGSDLIGFVEMPQAPGSYSATLTGDGSEYRISYSIAIQE